MLFGVTTPFDAATLAELYPSHEDYVQAFRRATGRLLDGGFILPVDARTLNREAARSDTPEADFPAVLASHRSNSCLSATPKRAPSNQRSRRKLTLSRNRPGAVSGSHDTAW